MADEDNPAEETAYALEPAGLALIARLLGGQLTEEDENFPVGHWAVIAVVALLPSGLLPEPMPAALTGEANLAKPLREEPAAKAALLGLFRDAGDKLARRIGGGA